MPYILAIFLFVLIPICIHIPTPIPTSISWPDQMHFEALEGLENIYISYISYEDQQLLDLSKQYCFWFTAFSAVLNIDIIRYNTVIK